jgi:hypothetical protein
VFLEGFAKKPGGGGRRLPPADPAGHALGLESGTIELQLDDREIKALVVKIRPMVSTRGGRDERLDLPCLGDSEGELSGSLIIRREDLCP